MKKPRLTIGCRARILTLKEQPKRREKYEADNEEHWRKEYGGREVLLKERSGPSFHVMLLGKGVTKLKKKDPHTIENEMAWVDERDMVLVDRKFNHNLDFMDWYQEHEYDFCGDCGAWREEAENCPNKDCPSHHLEDYEDEEE